MPIDLSKKIEEEFGIQAAAPMAAGMGAGGGGGGAAAEEEAEEQTEFDVILQAAGDKKIQVMLGLLVRPIRERDNHSGRSQRAYEPHALALLRWLKAGREGAIHRRRGSDHEVWG